MLLALPLAALVGVTIGVGMWLIWTKHLIVNVFKFTLQKLDEELPELKKKTAKPKPHLKVVVSDRGTLKNEGNPINSSNPYYHEHEKFEKEYHPKQ